MRDTLLCYLLSGQSFTSDAYVNRCGGFPHQAIRQWQLGVPKRNSILTLSTWGEHRVPRLRAQAPRLPPPNLKPQSQLQIVTCASN